MKLSTVNNCLLALIISVNIYVAAAPFLPSLLFKARAHGPEQQWLSRQVKTAWPAGENVQSRIVIPTMLLDQPLYEGRIADQYKTLGKGIWRWPAGSTPDRGSNTVLLAHRFTYTNPRGTFYFLDKVKVGDQMAVFWGQHKYVYKVTQTKVVLPSDTSIQQKTTAPTLTLFTCTPLWSPKNRLVVIARLESIA